MEGVVTFNMPFISKATTGNDLGFLCLGEKATVTKWYDKSNDRQKYIIEGESGAKDVQAKISSMSLSLNIKNLFILEKTIR